ncbi:LUD domain-containing protein [Spirosoma terrae]|uniref:Lactate utilization protein B/C n=1 Tax=Spirosoma terrae TaxID=1968276 RepID=A0A6L9LDV1_9BACT|nr:LUD domain-containing protein [Spirosoma terrae]NDU96983.1 lactate utilization protein B/C [Spirosoma terrae]
MAETSTRDTILAAIRRGKPDLLPLPDPIGFPPNITPDNLVESFMTMVKTNGGRAIRVSSMDEAKAFLATDYDLSLPVLSHVPGLDISNFTPAEELRLLDTLHLVVLEGIVGVAENAAIWVDEAAMGIRVLPFITLNLSIVISEKNLVGNMHEAYPRIDTSVGFGTFIAGPSKTADIEQSLVIGAHGSKTLTVFIME